MSERKILLCWFVVSLGLAGFVSPYASRLPDGLERIAQDLAFVDREGAASRSPTCDHLLQGSIVQSPRASLPGLTGVVIVFFAATLLGKALTAAQSKHRRRG